MYMERTYRYTTPEFVLLFPTKSEHFVISVFALILVIDIDCGFTYSLITIGI